MHGLAMRADGCNMRRLKTGSTDYSQSRSREPLAQGKIQLANLAYCAPQSGMYDRSPYLLRKRGVQMGQDTGPDASSAQVQFGYYRINSIRRSARHESHNQLPFA